MKSLLYAEPRLYDLVFPDPGETELVMCRTAIERFGDGPPRSALDLGCGTAKNLERLARTIPDCWGVDFLPSNIEYAKSVRPQLALSVGDMRSVRLGRTFDLVMCFGNALSYALTDADLAAVAETFAAHCRRDGLLMVDALNARSYLGGEFSPRVEGRVDTPEFTATSVATLVLDRAARRMTRTRVWRIAGQPDVEDFAEYRLLEPDELDRLVAGAGFDVLAMYDNRDFRASDLTGPARPESDVAGMRGRKLYVFARRREGPAAATGSARGPRPR